MRARSREWDGFRMTSIVGSVVLCALGHVYPITRAFICTRRRFRFARSIPHTRPDVLFVSGSYRPPLSRTPRRLENTLLYWSTAVGTTGPPPGNIPGRNKCGKSGVSYRPSTTNLATFLLSFPKLDRRRIERSILRSIDSRFLPPPNRPLLNSTETFLLARNEFRDFPSISHSSRGTLPLVKFHDR